MKLLDQSSNHHILCTVGEPRRQSGVSLGAAISQHGFSSRHERSERQSQINGAVAENLYRGRESQQTSSQQKQLQPDAGEALFGVKTRRIGVADNPGRWGDDLSTARPRATDNETKVISAAPSTATKYDDTEPESDSDKEKALAKQIRREERRLKREKEKKKHKHRKDHSHENPSRKKVHFPSILLYSGNCVTVTWIC